MEETKDKQRIGRLVSMKHAHCAHRCIEIDDNGDDDEISRLMSHHLLQANKSRIFSIELCVFFIQPLLYYAWKKSEPCHTVLLNIFSMVMQPPMRLFCLHVSRIACAAQNTPTHRKILVEPISHCIALSEFSILFSFSVVDQKSKLLNNLVANDTANWMATGVALFSRLTPVQFNWARNSILSKIADLTFSAAVRMRIVGER